MLENVVEGALGGTLLSAANQGGDSAGGAWGRRRREGGDGAFWDVCESESFNQLVMLYLVSWEFCQCLKRAHAESTRE